MMSDAKDICAREGCDVPRFMHDHGYLLDSKWHAFVEPAAKSAPVLHIFKCQWIMRHGEHTLANRCDPANCTCIDCGVLLRSHPAPAAKSAAAPAPAQWSRAHEYGDVVCWCGDNNHIDVSEESASEATSHNDRHQALTALSEAAAIIIRIPAAKSTPVPRCAQWDNDECTKDEPCDEGAAAEFCDLGESGDGPYCNPGYCYFREPDDASADADVRDILNRHGLPVPSIATTWNTKIVKAVREGYAAGIVAGRADGIDDRLNATLIIVRNEIEQARRGHRQGMPQKDLCYWDGRQTMAEDFERIFMDAIAARRAKA